MMREPDGSPVRKVEVEAMAKVAEAPIEASVRTVAGSAVTDLTLTRSLRLKREKIKSDKK